MEPLDLPTLTGLHLIPGLCDGVLTGVEALAGFPSLQTLPHTATLGHHGVNVHGTESRNKSMVVLIENPYEGLKTEEVAKRMVGERVFVGWPFVTEGMVVSVSDELFRYEKMRGVWLVLLGQVLTVDCDFGRAEALGHGCACEGL
jgi:5'-3' exoribonuclease 1